MDEQQVKRHFAQQSEAIHEVMENIHATKGPRFHDIVTMQLLIVQCIQGISVLQEHSDHPQAKTECPKMVELLLACVGHYLATVKATKEETQESAELAVSLANRLILRVPK